ncbi:MAG: nucleotidyl transferase AbiEii/AbiGii toxin family protein [Bacteroides sp.]|nr:nucleotidyl transferase AbiEii/AbiGii toxin family protein [Bacteroides sp.]
MKNIVSQSPEIRRRLYSQIGNKLGLHPLSVEKDLWVTTVLQVLFTLPYADAMVFKGGSSLSKVWNLIKRFSEDVDIAVDRKLFGIEGDVTKKQMKKLRKQSSLFVKEKLAPDLESRLEEAGIGEFCTVLPQPDGVGDGTYPEPRKIFIQYDTAFKDSVQPYVESSVMLEVGARSLIEPTAKAKVKSLIETNSPVSTTIVDSDIVTAMPEKTFLEKVFLLHELFSTEGCASANRKSRHLYDLESMMDMDFALSAVQDNELWDSIRHHRSVFTPIKGIDYDVDIRKDLHLKPPAQYLSVWRDDYTAMQELMVHGKSLSFDKLLSRMEELESRFE